MRVGAQIAQGKSKATDDCGSSEDGAHCDNSDDGTDGDGDGDGDAVAVMIEAGPHVLIDTRNKMGIYEQVLFEIEPPPPLTELEKKRREAAMRKEQPMNQIELDRMRTAADMLVNELNSVKETGNVDASISAIEAFTKTLVPVREDAADRQAS